MFGVGGLCYMPAARWFLVLLYPVSMEECAAWETIEGTDSKQ